MIRLLEYRAIEPASRDPSECAQPVAPHTFSKRAPSAPPQNPDHRAKRPDPQKPASSLRSPHAQNPPNQARTSEDRTAPEYSGSARHEHRLNSVAESQRSDTRDSRSLPAREASPDTPRNRPQ